MTSAHPSTGRHWYRFGPFVVDGPKRLLWRHRTLVPLTAKAFEILLVLIQKRDRVVEKQELLEDIWPRTAVEENTLTRHISTLRKALEERPDHHQYILTVPGHGYQFVAEVEELQARPDDLQHSFAAESANSHHPDDEQHEPVPPPPSVSSRLSPFVVVGTLIVLGLVTAAFVVSLGRSTPRVSIPQRTLRQFTFDAGLEMDPTWSPDAGRVAFASDRAGNSDIWIQSLDDPTPTQLTTWADEDTQPDWSPDGTRIVFRSEHDGGGLFVMTADGGEPRRIATFGYRPQWSPDGSTILFSSSGHPGGTPRFNIVGLDGQPPRPLRPDLLKDFAPLYVAWRAWRDGRTGRAGDRSFSVWGRHAVDGWTFLTADAAGGPAKVSVIDPRVEERQQTEGLTLGRFKWSASGRHLYFEGRAHEAQSLWRVAVDPATLAWLEADRLTTGTTQDAEASISSDGRRVVFSAKSVRTRVWMFPFDAAKGTLTGPGQPVTSGGAGEQDVDVPDDGSKLVYRTVRGGTQQVWVRDVADGRERLLVRGDQWTRTRPRWSSDGTQVSYLRRPRTQTGRAQGSLVVLAVDRGEERVLTPPDRPQIIPADWSADGRWLLGGCPQPATRRVQTCMIDVTENAAPRMVRRLTNDPVHNHFEQRFSPDGRWISFIAVNGADAGVSQVLIMPANGGAWQPITDGLSYDDKPHWAPDGKTLYFVSHRSGVLNVWGRRFDPLAAAPIGSIFRVTGFNSPRQMISTQLSAMQIALTSNRLFLPITEAQSELWILENVDR